MRGPRIVALLMSVAVCLAIVGGLPTQPCRIATVSSTRVSTGTVDFE